MPVSLDASFFRYYPVDPATLQADRLTRARALLKDQGWDAMLVAAGAATGQRGNARFLANYSTTTRFSALLFPAHSDATLFVPYPVHVYWAEGLCWAPQVRFTANLVADVAAAVASAGIRTLGLAGAEFLPAGVESALRQALPGVALVNGGEPFRRMRVIKSPADRKGMELAARMAQEAFDHVTAFVRPGATESQLCAEIQHFVRSQGAEDCLLLVSASALRAHPIPAHAPFQPGDAVVLSIEPVAPGGYWNQTIRVFSLGKPSSELRWAVSLCRDSQEAMALALVPGSIAREVCRLGNEALGRLAGTDDTPLGHGMGLDLGDPPRIEPGDETILAENMAIVLHPSVHTGKLGAFIGDTYWVEPGGPVRLSGLSQEIVVV